jgi:hypothetical protein
MWNIVHWHLYVSLTFKSVHCTTQRLLSVHCTTQRLLSIHCTTQRLLSVYCTTQRLLSVHCTTQRLLSVHCTTQRLLSQYIHTKRICNYNFNCMYLKGRTMTTYWPKHVAVLSFANTQQIFVLTVSAVYLVMWTNTTESSMWQLLNGSCIADKTSSGLCCRPVSVDFERNTCLRCGISAVPMECTMKDTRPATHSFCCVDCDSSYLFRPKYVAAVTIDTIK